MAPARPSATPEAVIQSEIRLAIGRDPDVVLWRNSAGTAEHFDAKSGRVRKQTFGLTIGASDLIGLVRVPVIVVGRAERPAVARFLALEVKRPGKNPTEEQELFLALVNEKGGVAAVVRSAGEALEVIAKAKAGTL